jgi:GNAT superfamily N-acetyltransferase
MYIKIKFRFWSIQPVFHAYDFHYYFYSNGHIIRPELPQENKYCNFKNIQTTEYSKIEDFKSKQFVNFIQENYLKNGENRFRPQEENIHPYFIGHNGPCFFTYYEDEQPIYDTKHSEMINHPKIISVITSRPLHVSMNNKKTSSHINVYYVDYLCVDQLHRKKGIAPQMIQTHEYNQRHQNKSISVSLFKRENELTGIVPLCVYNTYGFPTNKWVKPNDLPGGNISIVECGPTNIHHLVDFLLLNTNKFDISILPEIANILELNKTKNLYIYMIVQDHNVLCCYYFRNSCTNLKKSTSALTCFASINCCQDVGIFIHGYKVAFGKICETNKQYGFGYAVIEDISDNDVIIKNLQLKTVAEFIFPTAYFFYNYIYSTVPSKKAFIVN